MKFRIFYGYKDSFNNEGPKVFKFRVRFDDVAYWLIIDADGLEFRRTYPRAPFYDVLWCIYWKRRKS